MSDRLYHGGLPMWAIAGIIENHCKQMLEVHRRRTTT